MEQQRQYETFQNDQSSSCAADGASTDDGRNRARLYCCCCCCGWFLDQPKSCECDDDVFNLESYAASASTKSASSPAAVSSQPASAHSSRADSIMSAIIGRSASVTSTDLVKTIQEPFVTEDDEVDEAVKLGRIRFSIKYDFSRTTLMLNVMEAEKLVAMDRSGTSDPYVEVLLLPNKNKLTTHVKHKTLHPRWNEVFAFEGFPFEKVINSTLCMRVLDHDRFSKDDVIGELIIPMTLFDLTNGQTIWKNLQPASGHTGKLGELQISLCFDSASKQLTAGIVRARNLKAKDINGLSDPYVKIWLIQNGRRVEKKKTTVRRKTLNPIFDETITFSVGLDQLRSTSLEVSVIDYDYVGRNETIGRIVLGSKSGQNEVRHWNEMLAKPKSPVLKWHVLRGLA